MLCIERVAKSINKLKLWSQLEERQVEIASHTQFQGKRLTLELKVVAGLGTEVYHWRHASHEIRTMVVEAWRGKDNVGRASYISRLHVLMQLLGLAITSNVLRSQNTTWREPKYII